MDSSNNKIFNDIYLRKSYLYDIQKKRIPSGINIKVMISQDQTINMDIYEVSPGITLIEDNSTVIDRYIQTKPIFGYNDPNNTILVNCVLKGHCQIPVSNDRYMFIKENDVNMHLEGDTNGTFNYVDQTHVIHIIINRKTFTENENDENYIHIIDHLYKLVKVYTNLVCKANEAIRIALKELTDFHPDDPATKAVYYKLKALEILVLLYNSDIHDEGYDQRTYTDSQIRVVRKIQNQLSRDIASYVSLEVISASYGINLTTLKNCFKDMYGKPLYSWYREYKFHRAKDLIENTDYPIKKIANMIGYKSSSKFTKAFKQEMDVLPSSYRKKKRIIKLYN
ncbi:MAG: AraC family transcriptional regulator [Methanosphaera sp.]|nr:AraC family transcriptional regulator [Methanosphaera sp.]